MMWKTDASLCGLPLLVREVCMSYSMTPPNLLVTFRYIFGFVEIQIYIESSHEINETYFFKREWTTSLQNFVSYFKNLYIEKNSCRGIDQIINFCFSENTISLENTKYFSSLLKY